MAHDVFISHSADDKPVADSVCAYLEAGGLRCWIAPRDILPGQEYGSALLAAIAASRIVVLVLSRNAASSQHVLREIERAVHLNVPILPFRIDEVEPEGSLGFFIGTTHWLDALTAPFEPHLTRLLSAAQVLLQGASLASGTPGPLDGADLDSRALRRSIQEGLGRHLRVIGLLAGLSLAVAGGLLVYRNVTRPDPSTFNVGQEVEVVFATSNPDKAHQEAPELHIIQSDNSLLQVGRIGNGSRLRIAGRPETIKRKRYWPVDLDRPCYLPNQSFDKTDSNGRYITMSTLDETTKEVTVVYPFSTLELDTDKFTTGGRCYDSPKQDASIVVVFYAFWDAHGLRESTKLRLASHTPEAGSRVNGSTIIWYKVSFGREPYWIADGHEVNGGKPKFLKAVIQ